MPLRLAPSVYKALCGLTGNGALLSLRLPALAFPLDPFRVKADVSVAPLLERGITNLLVPPRPLDPWRMCRPAKQMVDATDSSHACARWRPGPTMAAGSQTWTA
eukprot:scaffold916_cov516-Prasinococcus_capsulatus_cf.AAC.5